MRLRISGWSLAMLGCLILATWPVWRWYLARTCDGSDEPYGLLALLTFAVLSIRPSRSEPIPEKQFVVPAILLIVYAGTYSLLPPLLRGVLAITAIGSVLLPKRRNAGLWGLLLLSLPIVATVQFYAGYPLRWLAAEGSTLCLKSAGFDVYREGSLLRWAGETVMVDAPCSGVHMLWFGCYLTCLLAALARFTLARTLLAGSISMIIVIGANIVRATALFFKEARMIILPEWTHAGIGVALFAIAAWMITTIHQRLAPAT